METMKINKLEIENVKRVKAVKLEPMANGLTIIGGDNNQGRRPCWTPSHGRSEGTGTGRLGRRGKALWYRRRCISS